MLPPCSLSVLEQEHDVFLCLTIFVLYLPGLDDLEIKVSLYCDQNSDSHPISAWISCVPWSLLQLLKARLREPEEVHQIYFGGVMKTSEIAYELPLWAAIVVSLFFLPWVRERKIREQGWEGRSCYRKTSPQILGKKSNNTFERTWNTPEGID